MIEVIYAAAKARGYTPEMLDSLREKKADSRGRFDKKIMLFCVMEEGDGQ